MFVPVVLDVEATTEKSPRELIEIGAVELHPQTFDVQRSFQSYVRPMHHQALSDHCKKLTGITQEDIDAARPLSQVWPEFQQWALAQRTAGDVVLCGWGPFDWWWLRDECRAQDLHQPFTRYLDVMAEVAYHFRCWVPGFNSKRIGLLAAARQLEIAVDHAELHGAMYDAELAALVLQHVMDLRRMPPEVRALYGILQRLHPTPLTAGTAAGELKKSTDEVACSPHPASLPRAMSGQSRVFFSPLIRGGRIARRRRIAHLIACYCVSAGHGGKGHREKRDIYSRCQYKCFHVGLHCMRPPDRGRAPYEGELACPVPRLLCDLLLVDRDHLCFSRVGGAKCRTRKGGGGGEHLSCLMRCCRVLAHCHETAFSSGDALDGRAPVWGRGL